MKLTLEYIKQLVSDNESADIEFKETTGQLINVIDTFCDIINGNGLGSFI